MRPRLELDAGSRVPAVQSDVVGHGSTTGAALRLALERPELVDHLVLISPLEVDEALAARLGEIRHPTLIVQGTETSPETARRLKAGLPRAFLVYVWQDDADRTQKVVERFLEHSEAFVVNRS